MTFDGGERSRGMSTESGAGKAGKMADELPVEGSLQGRDGRGEKCSVGEGYQICWFGGLVDGRKA